MRAAVRPFLLVLLAGAGCRTGASREVYAGVGPSVLPHVGGTLTAGQFFSTHRERHHFAFEARATFQGGRDAPGQSGRFFQAQAGVRQLVHPDRASHPVVRYGAVWLRATGDPAILSRPGDYLGAYLGIGYEWDLSPHVTVGPELNVLFLEGEGSLGFEVLPQLGFGIFWNF